MVSFHQISPPKLSTHLSYLPTYYMPNPSYSSRFDRPSNIWLVVQILKLSNKVAQIDVVTPWVASCNNSTTAERVVITSDTGEFYQNLSAYFNFSLKMWSSQHDGTEEYCGWNHFTYFYLCNRICVISFKIFQPCLPVSLRAGLPRVGPDPGGGERKNIGPSERGCRQG